MPMIFDAHLHIIDHRFSLVKNNGYLPAPFTVSDYLHSVKPYNIQGGAVVSGSFQAFDQHYLVDALKLLGPCFVGVTQIPRSTTDEQIIQLHQAGVRALRFNLIRGGSAHIDDLEYLAMRVHELVRWHVELYIDSQSLDQLYQRLIKLPQITIDHLGLSKSGFKQVLQLAEHGARVKACGFGRVDFDQAEAIKSLASANENALIFGTDLPSTRAPRPFHGTDIDIIKEHLSPSLAKKALYHNAIDLYKPMSRPSL